MGEDTEIAALAELAQGNIAVPGENSACQWVKAQANSEVFIQNITDLTSNPQNVLKLQAIRRDGKFIRLTNDPALNHIEPGDLVLLCGELSALNQLEQLLTISFTPQP